MPTPLKLNLGCGSDYRTGYVNIDKYGDPDILLDLEEYPWPWEDNSTTRVILKHVLEHLGKTTEIYFGIIREIYRICTAGARIDIIVPHPRHDTFLDDPTHVRTVTPASLHLSSKSKNKEWQMAGSSNTPLGLYLDVDFEVVDVNWVLDPVRIELLKDKDEIYISQAMKRYNNVVVEIQMIQKVVKQ